MSQATLANAVNTSATPGAALTEDWLSVWIGLLIFVLALAGVAGPNLLGWVVSTSVWSDPDRKSVV